MLFLFLSLAGLASEPKAEIVVTDSRYEEIYVEEPIVISNGQKVSTYAYDTTSIFMYMNQKHRSWFKSGKVSAIYNHDTVGFINSDCDYGINALKCANEDGLWVLRTVINEDSEQASINLLLFDERGVVIGQANRSKSKKVTVIERQKVTQTQQAGQPMSVSASKCDKASGDCNGGSYSGIQPGPTQTFTEDLEPTVIEISPRIRDIDIDQAVIMLYDSIR